MKCQVVNIPTLQQQAKMVGLGDRWADIKKMYHQVNMMFGDIIKVTPSL